MATVQQSQGSLYISSNSSYSGADIKIVVNLPDPDITVNQQILTLDRDTDQLKKDAEVLQSNIDELSYNLYNNYKKNTPEYQDASKLHTKLVNQLFATEEAISNNMLRSSTLTAIAPDATSKVLSEVQTLSISTYRDKQAVKACGSVYPHGYTRGQRTIAGTIVFTVFDEHVLYQLLSAHPSDFDGYIGQTSALIDQLPPLDITVVFANEYGYTSRLAIYGVEFVDDGMTMSIEDILTEEVVSWVARDIDPMRGVSELKIDESTRNLTKNRLKRASDLILEEDYKEYTNNLDPWGRFFLRRNSFI